MASLLGVVGDHIPIGRSSLCFFTFEVINWMNAVKCSCSLLVQFDALKIVRSRDGTNFFA